MNNKVTKKSTLINKLKKTTTRVQELRRENAGAEMPDIEDIIADKGEIKSQFFSPIQTRRQRKNNENPPKAWQEDIASINTQQDNRKRTKVPKTQTKKEKLSSELENNKIIDKTEGIKTEGNVDWEPLHWQQMLSNIREMRANNDAPVDTMGCHKCADNTADEKTRRFQKLVALMLSSQTKDETTFAAMQRLISQGLTPERLLVLENTKLAELLHPVSFYKNKAKYLQQTAQILIDRYDADIPDNVNELVKLPGVGPKMAHICMATAWNKVTGIGVDVHVHRIANRLRWVPKETKEPEQTRNALEAWLPRELWADVNHLLVGFGQTVCTPQYPHCDTCLNRQVCPSAINQTKPTTKTRK